MPGGDRTGPRGMGPMTGRAAGYCAGYDVPGYANPIVGGRGAYGWGGRGYGRGGGWGWRNRFYATGLPGYARAAQGMQAWGGGGGPYPIQDPYAAPMTSENELAILKAESENLVQTLEDIKKRIEELESEVKKK